jgi:murein DD-endopeptidase MepM/ murein hydrolase activator NlpD
MLADDIGSALAGGEEHVGGRLDPQGAMFTNTTHSNGSARSLAVLAVAALAAGALAVGSPHAGSGSTATTSYGYPVKPFASEHPVRGNFGDPRTLFRTPPTTAGALYGAGSFQFHFGVDVAAPDGTAVYPVVSGTVSGVSRDWAGVSCSDGRAFQYWHITPTVRVGDRVTAYETVLGRIIRGSMHVHLTELQGGQPVNPLQAGHLTPYTDTHAPHIVALTVGHSVSTLELPNFLRGRVDFIAEVDDRPNLPVRGIWRNMPVAPARVTWHVENMLGRKVLGPTVAVDFRAHIPSASRFWNVYARGSFQNMSVFGKHYSYMQPGRYLYRLTPAAFDTETLKDGVYDLVVSASDIRGNTSTESLRITIHNRPGWIGS